MRLTSHHWLAGILAYCLVASSAFAAAARVSQMIVVQDEQSTKALIELSQTTVYKAFMLQSPTRVVIDIDDAELGPNFRLPGSNGIVLSARQGKTPSGIRLVLDLSQNADLSAKLDQSSGKTRLIIVLQQNGGDIQKTAGVANVEPSIATVSAPHAAPVTPIVESKPMAKNLPNTPASIKAPPASNPKLSNVPGGTNVGYALMDDEIVQINIDSSGETPKTTVQSSNGKPTPSSSAALPNSKALLNSGQVQPLPKKAKTVSDVLGSSARKLVIAIDAGHGGKDPGAHGPTGVKEKDITLRIAKELASAINADPGMRAVLIRDSDEFVVLQNRYQRARQAQADLFVSIHADAALNNAANGSSVYVLSTKGASSQAARWLADKENAADLVGGVSLDDKDKNLSAVLLDLSQSATMRMSEDVADMVLQSLKDLGKTHKVDVEHANFVVLRSPDVPSMLVETGFITNPEEERKLSDSDYRKRLAYAISLGVRNYFIQQPLPGTYYAKKSNASGAGVTAAGTGIIP